MNQLLELFAEYGLLAIFTGVFVEQIGAPIPAFPFLLMAGMDGLHDSLFALWALVVAAVASMLADLVWFWAGRLQGQRVLSRLCKISISPDSCVRQSELSFAKRGVATLVISKFVPGLSTLAPPMAGALGMSTKTFVIFNLARSALWAGSGIAMGILFHSQIQTLLTVMGELGNAALAVVGILFALYITVRLYRRVSLSRLKARLPQVQPTELAQMMNNGAPVVLLDVRPAGVGLALSEGIAGATSVDLTRLEQDWPMEWHADTVVVTYCSCPNDASAVKAARALHKRGCMARVLRGGLEGWIQAGLPLDDVKSHNQVEA